MIAGQKKIRIGFLLLRHWIGLNFPQLGVLKLE